MRRYQNEALPSLEAEYVRAKALMDQCMQNIDVCGDKPETFEDLRDGAEAAMGRYERGLDRVAEMEADLYPLNQEVDRACGGRP